jgi:hypothetical protein
MARWVGLLGLALLASLLPAESRVATAASSKASLPFVWVFPHLKSGGHWTSSSGGLTFDGKTIASIPSPLKISRGTGFAVQAEIRILGPGPFNANLLGAGVFARTAPKDVHTTVEGGSFVSGASDSENDGPQLEWSDVTAGAGTAFDPKADWHTYRLEVSGEQYGLFIDGQKMVQHALPAYQNPVQVGVFSDYERINVRKFVVVPAAPPAIPSVPDPPLDRMVLQLSDLPTDVFFKPTMHHVYANEEVARTRGVSLAALESAGRLVSFGVDFLPLTLGLPDVFSSVAAYQSPQQAAADAQALTAHFKVVVVAQGGTDVVDFPGSAGQSSAGYMFHAHPGGLTMVLFAQRGRYLSETIVLDDPLFFPENDAVALTTQLAMAVDTHIQDFG